MTEIATTDTMELDDTQDPLDDDDHADSNGGELVPLDDTETVEGELLPSPEPLSESKAKALDKRIRTANGKVGDGIGTLFELLAEAQAGQIDVALGYDSWSAYLDDAVTVIPANRGQRKALVSTMTGMGVSERIVANVLGTSQATVSRDLAEASDAGVSLPDEVVGQDGRTTKPKRKTAEEPIEAEEVALEEKPAKPPPVSADFADEMGFLANSVAAFKDILEDDRFAKAAKTIAKRHLNTLQEHITELTKVVDALMDVAP
jgi:hypothetical protein